MSNQHAVDRQKKIVEILKLLHEGGDFETAKAIFDDTFDGVDVAEITSAERELIATGLNPMEIQNLCNVHAAVFRGKIKPGEATPVTQIPGHPVQVLKLENTVLMSLINDELLPTLKKWQQDGHDDHYLERMKQALSDLLTIDVHYTRKENLIFPLMDKYGITAPPKVMWGVDDEIRQWIKDAYNLVTQTPLPDPYAIEAAIEKACKEVDEMVFKEEEIMVPMVLEVFTPADWALVQRESGAIGYTLIAEPLPWHPTEAELKQKPKPSKFAAELNAMAQSLAEAQSLGSERPQSEDQAIINQIHQGVPMPSASAATMNKLQQTSPADVDAPQPRVHVKPRRTPKNLNGAPTSDNEGGAIEIAGDQPARVLLPTGAMNLAELTHVLRLLPLDLTFVDAEDTVRWFSDTKDRLFPRTTAVLGRKVQNCHPPKSLDRVQAIVSDFKAGTRDHADFWFNHRGRDVYVRYFAIRDLSGNYLGCLEVTQDITDIKQLSGEKKL